jgi:very-short-patch-repair endonuclease
MLMPRLRAEQPDLGLPLSRSFRPLAAERHPDGRLATVLGCWWAPDLALFEDPLMRERLDHTLGPMLEDQVETQVVEWPAGMARSAASEEEVPAPDLMGSLPPDARAQADACEGPLQRWFFARAYAQGLRLECQHVIDHYRVDFALPHSRVAAEILGWEARHGPRDRERGLGDRAWRVLWFAGEEVHADADRCVAALKRAMSSRPRGPAPGSRGAGRWDAI